MHAMAAVLASGLALVGLAGCSQSAEVRLLESSGIYEPDAERAQVVFATDHPIDRHVASHEARPAEGRISICGLAGQFSASGPVVAAASGRYSVLLPGMAQRGQLHPDGEVTTGWPSDLARRRGICFRVEAAEMLWLTLTSDETPLPR